MALPSAAELPSPREPGAPYRVCLVCLGNICRSPMAETVLRAELAAAGLAGETAGAVVVDSAGTGDWHVGEMMDPDARKALAGRGHDGSGHRARQFEPSWLSRYDLSLAMDARTPVAGTSPIPGAAARTSSAVCSTCSARPHP